MSAASSRDLVRQGVLKGISDSYSSYKKMAGDPLHKAPEFFLATNIAAELYRKAKPCWVTLESNIKDVLKKAGTNRKGRASQVSATSFL